MTKQELIKIAKKMQAYIIFILEIEIKYVCLSGNSKTEVEWLVRSKK